MGTVEANNQGYEDKPAGLRWKDIGPCGLDLVRRPVDTDPIFPWGAEYEDRSFRRLNKELYDVKVIGPVIINRALDDSRFSGLPRPDGIVFEWKDIGGAQRLVLKQLWEFRSFPQQEDDYLLRAQQFSTLLHEARFNAKLFGMSLNRYLPNTWGVPDEVYIPYRDRDISLVFVTPETRTFHKGFDHGFQHLYQVPYKLPAYSNY
jgi:hypothetical protein